MEHLRWLVQHGQDPRSAWIRELSSCRGRTPNQMADDRQRKNPCSGSNALVGVRLWLRAFHRKTGIIPRSIGRNHSVANTIDAVLIFCKRVDSPRRIAASSGCNVDRRRRRVQLRHLLETRRARCVARVQRRRSRESRREHRARTSPSFRQDPAAIQGSPAIQASSGAKRNTIPPPASMGRSRRARSGSIAGHPSLRPAPARVT